MREPIPVSRTKLAELEAEIKALKAKLSDVFCAEEMDAIREQLTERAVLAEEAREQLEWKMRLELARVREAEAASLRAAAEMREVAESLARLLGEGNEEDAETTRPQHFTHARGRRLFV